MNTPGPNPYLRTKVLTASPEELRLMLYDGAIKFCHQAKTTLTEAQHEATYSNLMKAQKIVLELSTSLNHEADPDLCSKLSSLYTYIYRRLVDASVNHDGAALDEAIKLLAYERDTWQMLMERLAKDNQHTAPHRQKDIHGAQQTAISSLSVNG